MMPRTVVSTEKEQTYRQLLEKARAALVHSYSPYSDYAVGVAVQMDDGSIYTGCNVENVNLTVGICGERTTFVKAISEGKRTFKTVAIVAKKSKDTWPCGHCRQFMREFGADTVVVIESSDGTLHTMTTGELLPDYMVLPVEPK